MGPLLPILHSSPRPSAAWTSQAHSLLLRASTPAVPSAGNSLAPGLGNTGSLLSFWSQLKCPHLMVVFGDRPTLAGPGPPPTRLLQHCAWSPQRLLLAEVPVFIGFLVYRLSSGRSAPCGQGCVPPLNRNAWHKVRAPTTQPSEPNATNHGQTLQPTNRSSLLPALVSPQQDQPGTASPTVAKGLSHYSTPSF